MQLYRDDGNCYAELLNCQHFKGIRKHASVDQLSLVLELLFRFSVALPFRFLVLVQYLSQCCTVGASQNNL